jgi:acyl-CoA synthetase (AMP-forming)/AMP-acid ligase II
VAIPDAFWGERPKAFVVLRHEAVATEAEIIGFCRDILAHFKCPVAVQFGDLPKPATGKIRKSVLRDRESAGHQSRVH